MEDDSEVAPLTDEVRDTARMKYTFDQEAFKSMDESQKAETLQQTINSIGGCARSCSKDMNRWLMFNNTIPGSLAYDANKVEIEKFYSSCQDTVMTKEVNGAEGADPVIHFNHTQQKMCLSEKSLMDFLNDTEQFTDQWQHNVL